MRLRQFAEGTSARSFRRPVVVHGVPVGVSYERGTLVLAGAGRTLTVFAVLDRRDALHPPRRAQTRLTGARPLGGV